MDEESPDVTEEATEERGWKTRITAVGTLSVTLLAFFIPSLEDQWDRLQQRRAVEDYRTVSSTLMAESKFREAEQILEKAIELSGGSRLDLERERLVAKTAQVNTDPSWSGRIDDALEESDFLVLEAMQAHSGDLAARAWTLNNHAVFVANHGEPKRALPLVEQALAQAPDDARIQVTLGNVHWDLDHLDAATHAYLAALARDPDNVPAHFNLALVYETQGKLSAAIRELQRVLALHPEDAARAELASLEHS